MAGDWIKMRVDLADDPAVIAMAAALRKDEDTVVGKLHRLWSWADRHTKDGTTSGVNAQWVDRYVACKGFALAMAGVGWLEISDDFVRFPHFDRHNGESAKARCDAQLRQRLSRAQRNEGERGDDRDNIPRPFRRFVLSRDGHQCVYCGTESTPEREENARTSRLSIDHIKPAKRGGKTVIENLATCCKLCNQEKNDRTPEEWDLLPTFLQPGVEYINGHICVTKPCDTKTPNVVTREEESKRRARGEPFASKGNRKTNGRSVSDQLSRLPINACDGGKEPYDLSGVSWDHVKAMAERLGRKIPCTGVDGRRAWLKYAVLADHTFGEHWLMDAIEATLHSSAEDPQAYFVGVLKKKAREHDPDADVIAMAEHIEIPPETWKSPVLGGPKCTTT